MIKRRNQNQSLRPQVDVGDILNLVGNKMITRKSLNKISTASNTIELGFI